MAKATAAWFGRQVRGHFQGRNLCLTDTTARVVIAVSKNATA
jgi:hypothetical protein